MTAPRRAPASGRPAAPTAAGPHPNARAVYEHVERYLVGACNEEALETWRLAVGTGLDRGWPLDGILLHMCELFIKDGRGR